MTTEQIERRLTEISDPLADVTKEVSVSGERQECDASGSTETRCRCGQAWRKS